MTATASDRTGAEVVVAAVLDDLAAGRDEGDAIQAAHDLTRLLPEPQRFAATLACCWLDGIRRRGDSVAGAASDALILLQLLGPDHAGPVRHLGRRAT